MDKLISRDDAINLAIKYKASNAHIASICKLPNISEDDDSDNFTTFISTSFTRSWTPDISMDVYECVKCFFMTKDDRVVVDSSWTYCPKCGRRICKK